MIVRNSAISPALGQGGYSSAGKATAQGRKGCAVHFVKENLHFSGDETDPTQELLLSMLGAVYQLERSILLERQREGIAVAKLAGKYKGRPKSIDNHEIRRILAEGNSISKTVGLLGVSMSSVQRAKKENRAL